MNKIFNHFKHIVVKDYEFRQTAGNHPEPVCVCYKDLKTGEIIKQWLVGHVFPCPFPVDETLFIAHWSTAEVSCDIVMGYSKPKYIWDTYVEDRKLYNGRVSGKGAFNLLNCCKRHGIQDVMDGYTKEYWRDHIINNYPNYIDEDKPKIMDYCLADVLLTEKLFLKQVEKLEKFDDNFTRVLQQAIFHARAMAVAAQVEHNGIPLNLALYNDLDKHYPEVREAEIIDLEKVFDVYEYGKFNHKKFENALQKENLLNRWPRTATGRLKTDDRTFYRFSAVNKNIAFYRDAKFIIESRTLAGFCVGKDGRSRAPLNLFGQITGRANVGTAKNPFGAPRRMRTVIGTSGTNYLIYADWKSQEAVIQAYLSNDQEMIVAVNSGDPYLYTAKKVGAVPIDAIRKKYELLREIYKQCFLATSYGQTPFGLKNKLGITLPNATYIHSQISRLYKTFFEWTNNLIAKAMQRGYFMTKYGWKYHLSKIEVVNPRRLLNWPIQSHGSEILRMAMKDLDEQGFEISMTIHDAVLIHCSAENKSFSQIRNNIRLIQKIMRDAAEKIIGAPINVDVKLIRGSFTQSGEHKIRWDQLYQKLQVAKSGRYSSTSERVD